MARATPQSQWKIWALLLAVLVAFNLHSVLSTQVSLSNALRDGLLARLHLRKGVGDHGAGELASRRPSGGHTPEPARGRALRLATAA